MANMYAFEGEYTFSEPLFYAQCQHGRRRGKTEQIGLPYPLSIVVAYKGVRTEPGHPPSVIEVLQGGDATFEAEERIPQRRGVAKSSE